MFNRQIIRSFTLCALCLFPLQALTFEESLAPNRIFFQAQNGNIERAIELYEQRRQELGHHDFEAIEKLGLILLEKGYRSDDLETRLMSFFGAGISLNEKALTYLEEGIKSGIPQFQLICLNLLAKFADDEASDVINLAMSSPFLAIRFEAAYLLAEKKHPKASGQIEALMHKVDRELYPLFPILYAPLNNEQSHRAMKKFLGHTDENVRVMAVNCILKAHNDEFLPQLRRMVSHPGWVQQEACASALGSFKDEASIDKLKALTRSSHMTVRLAANLALARLGMRSFEKDIEAQARQGDLYAITILGELEGYENTLYKLTKQKDYLIQLNANIALLKRKNERCLPFLKQLLVQDSRHLHLTKEVSQGKSLHFWKTAPAIASTAEETAMLSEMHSIIKEDLLAKAVDLKESSFLELAAYLFDHHQNDLVPSIVKLIEQLQTPQAIALLKKYSNTPGAPLIRNFCNLALYRLNESGPYGDNLRKWLVEQQDTELVRFKPLVPWEQRLDDQHYELTMEEKSSLFLQALEAFALTRDEQGFDAVLTCMKTGNAKNLYALAGFLLRVSQ